MSIPGLSFQDGLDDTQEPFSERKHSATVQRLMASLEAACAELKELNFRVRNDLRDDPLYMKWISQLVAPIYSIPQQGHWTTKVDEGESSAYVKLTDMNFETLSY